MPVRGEAATGEARVHGEEVGRHAMLAQSASPVAAATADGASAKRGDAGVRAGHSEVVRDLTGGRTVQRTRRPT